MEYQANITEYILDNLPGDAERVYPRTTKNFYYIITPNWQLWFSYRTLIAFRKTGNIDTRVNNFFISRNAWSVTTGKHLYWIDSDHTKRLDFEVFEALALEHLGDDFGNPKRDTNPFRSAGMVSALFSVMHSKEDQSEAEKKKANNQRIRFYQASYPGVLIPQDWDDLTAAEQSRRLDMVDKTALA